MKKGISLSLAGSLCLVLAATAFGGVKSTVVLLNPALDGHYYGNVISQKGKCERGRTVTVWHDENENGGGPPDFKIGSTRTNGDGRYALDDAPQAPDGDQIAATVKKKVKGKTVCKATSTTAVAGAAAP